MMFVSALFAINNAHTDTKQQLYKSRQLTRCIVFQTFAVRFLLMRCGDGGEICLRPPPPCVMYNILYA